MKAPLSPDNSLRLLFAEHLDEKLDRALGPTDPRLRAYLCDLLVNFASVDRLYSLRNASGRRIEEVAEMLEEGEVRMAATSFSREREVHRHIGDFTLFWSGVFPEAMPRLRSATCKDHLVDYVRQGKESYYIVSTFNVGKWKEEAPLFRELSVQFDLLRYGLSRIREAWDQLAQSGGS